jgi:hypothetical protein
MSDEKTHQFRPPLYHDRPASKREVHGSRAAEESREQQGWEAYRKWLSRVSGQPSPRAPLDGSIYSWKGYQNWADRVRQTWKSEET